MRFALTFIPLVLAACVTSAPPPIVSDYNGHMAKIIYHSVPLGDAWRSSPTYEAAKQACGRDAVYQGVRQINQYQGEHVYMCV